MCSNLRGTAGSNVEVNKTQTETNETNTNREQQVQTEMNVGEVAKRPRETLSPEDKIEKKKKSGASATEVIHKVTYKEPLEKREADSQTEKQTNQKQTDVDRPLLTGAHKTYGYSCLLGRDTET